MKMQLIETHVPVEHFNTIDQSLKSFPHRSYWVSKASDQVKLIRMIVENQDVEDVLNYLEKIAHVSNHFKTILVPVHSFISKETIESRKNTEKDDKGQSRLLRISRQELVENIEKNSYITMNYTLLIILSAIVATVGFIKDSEAVVIGAMVIAPLIGPVISIAFSAILGDYKKIAKSTGTLLYGVAIAVLISVAFSYFFQMGTNTDQFIARTEVTISDFALALASGAAGALSILNRLSGSLVGVMVAVALLPPLVSVGLSLGQSLWSDAYGATMLVIVNITCILLSAITIFSLSGIRPIRFKEVQKAHASRTLSFVFVGTIVAILIIVILIGQGVKME
ncbi:TIGR00341 family protein [Salirhabdus sp. Marseille-P4669]|uniref:TIGR00341 family protein n=1 Tax=Salirhabdus sp. Marseille-P4669 TaxID=2042310 RepID=UPI000C7A02C5|nr:TIGR00341 family protein [Salirhabdus sp. Marseille-P4669]